MTVVQPQYQHSVSQKGIWKYRERSRSVRLFSRIRSARSGHFNASVNFVAGGYDVYRGPATLYFFTNSRSTFNMLIGSDGFDQARDILQLRIRRHAMAQVK